MASHNEITGDALVSKRNNDAYRDNYDRIFGKKKNGTTTATDPIQEPCGAGRTIDPQEPANEGAQLQESAHDR